MQRKTKQRDAIMAIMADETDFRSAQQVHTALVVAGQTVGLATVYRNLQALTEAGELDSLRSEDGETLYRRCAKRRHHHHLVCRNCGYTVDIQDDQLEQWIGKIARRYRFSDIEHMADVFGLCESCESKLKK
ncbi:Fur family transcriptional regulator [Varibaculum timonense]|uniref:Fur family transcriptional regulator n=1 Tax=Varibaculum timonense TaxID=1964383 RepID=UPI0022E1D7F2|nr:Fur family transcriptional regulator [Varibaculum timonense]